MLHINKIANSIKFSINSIFQCQCFLCDSEVSCIGLCNDCWKNLNFICHPCCMSCGKALQFDCGIEACDYCINKDSFLDGSRSLLKYDEYSKKIVLPFKYNGFYKWLPLIERFLSIDKSIFEEIDLIVPVPLHWTRLISRGYNQSLILSILLSKFCKKPYENALKRIKMTKSQGHFTYQERVQNVEGVFSLNKEFFGKQVSTELIGKRVLLVDDVRTTGATLESCAKTLKQNGAQSVFGFTICLV